MENNKLSKNWDEIHQKYVSTYDEWFNKYIELFKDKEIRVVELGCGRAYTSKYMYNEGFKNIVACDFSEIALKAVKEESKIETMLVDMTNELPFEDESIDLVIADLCLHYFDKNTTNFIINEIKRVLKPSGYLIGRVNSINDELHIPENYEIIEKNFFYDGMMYKKFFDKSELIKYFEKFKIHNIDEKLMDRYEKPKILLEFCVQKIIN